MTLVVYYVRFRKYMLTHKYNHSCHLHNLMGEVTRRGETAMFVPLYTLNIYHQFSIQEIITFPDDQL